MCGRFALHSSPRKIEQAFGVEAVTGEMKPSYNIAPGDEVCAIIRQENTRMGKLRWGLVPPWAKELPRASGLINARAETLADKPSFKRAFRERRCLIPADGFYEWKDRQPWYCAPAGDTLFGFAGLWETWRGTDQDPYHSCTIITAEASKSMRAIHDRMPVILTPEAIEKWLDPATTDPDTLRAILTDGRITKIRTYPVSKFVDSPRNNDPRCIEPIAD